MVNQPPNQPSAENTEQAIILHGSQKMLKPVIMQILAMKQIMDTKDWGNIYGIPVTTFQDQYRWHHPQIKLAFYETAQEAGYKKSGDLPPVHGQITFALINETEKTMTPAKATIIAEKIKTKFVTGTLFKWNRGKLIATYLDKLKGYDFRLRVKAESDARNIIESVMDIQSHSPEWSRLTMHESKASFPELPGKELIYGELRRLPRKRPIRTISFRYAEMTIWGVPPAISLVDTTGYRSTPLVSL